MQIRRLYWLVGGTCERLTVVSLNGVLRRTHFAKPPKKDIVDVTAMGKEVKYSYYLHFFVHKASIYQNYNLQRATNTNRGKIDGVSNQGH